MLHTVLPGSMCKYQGEGHGEATASGAWQQAAPASRNSYSAQVLQAGQEESYQAHQECPSSGSLSLGRTVSQGDENGRLDQTKEQGGSVHYGRGK